MRHGTYSIVAFDPGSRELGAAVQSHWFSVGSLCTWARPGVGAVATQSVVEPAHGPHGLDRMAAGEPAPGALGALLAADPLWETRVDLRVADHEDPLGELERLLRLHRAYALAGDGDELMGAGRVEEAGPLYLRAAELAPESEELRFWAGLALAQAGALDEGVDAVRRAAAIQPGLLTLLDRLSPDFAPAGEQVRRALGR